MDDEPLGYDEAMEFLGLRAHTMKRLVRSGQIPCRKVGYTLLFLKSELVEWLRSQPLRSEVAG